MQPKEGRQNPQITDALGAGEEQPLGIARKGAAPSQIIGQANSHKIKDGGKEPVGVEQAIGFA